MRCLLLGTAAACAMCAACQEPGPRLNAPPHGAAVKTSELQSTFVHMMDNALLEDMTISDLHFMPHRPMLNQLGEERLCRLASLMEVWGGQIRFNTDLTDDELIEQRKQAIMDFLADAGVDTTAEVLGRDLPGGQGMPASEAILIKANEATYAPSAKQGTSD